jgi:hypothetical protein
MSEFEYQKINQKLDMLIRVIAIGLIEDRTQNDQMRLLAKVGLQPKEIADLLGTTANTVRVGLSKQRKLVGSRSTSKKKSKPGRRQDG